MDEVDPKPRSSGPYNPEIFASQLSRMTSRFSEPDVEVKSQFIRKPDPFTVYLGYWGTTGWQVAYATLLIGRLRDGSFLVNRGLTQPEVDAYVESHNVLVANFTRGIPAGFFAGAGKWFLYERNYQHFLKYAPPAGQPGMTPLGRFLEGTKMMWSFDRGLVKNLFTSLARRLILWTCLGTFGLEVAGVFMSNEQLLNDPRMAQHKEDKKQVSPEVVRALRAQAVKEREAIQAQGIKERLAQKNQAAQMGEEPTPQNGGFDQSGYASDSASSVTTSNTTAYPPSETTSAPATGTYSYGSRAPAEQDKGTGFFDDDDASPTAPEYRETPTGGQGSAWERLRSQAQSGIPPNSGSASSGGSAWTQSEASVAASESQRERERAQAEFNRLLDAERNQSNDSGSGRGWK
ncbi:hypothetical protein BJX65DRAFT_10053 [Aspergillus insuetus]